VRNAQARAAQLNAAQPANQRMRSIFTPRHASEESEQEEFEKFIFQFNCKNSP
jgi:hypothetical protein